MASEQEDERVIKKLFTPRIRILWLVLAMGCLLYAGMVYLVHSGTFSFVIWIAGAAFFGTCFFLAGKGRWGKVPKWLRRATYVILGLGAAVFLACQVAILSHYFDRGEPDLDYVIVLGAQVRSTGPSVIYRYRLDKAAEYLKENPGTKCIPTGGQGDNEPMSEGAGGAEYLVSQGVSRDRIIVEKTSRDTVENLQNALESIGKVEGSTDGLRIGIVTNGFHVFRGVRIADNLTDASVCGIAAYMQPQYIPNNLVREMFGIIRDFLRGIL
jgi:uncharacterized SAM-binding protein YcdF (DUF218 family)